MPDMHGDISKEEIESITSFIKSKNECKHENLFVHNKVGSFKLPTHRFSPSRGEEKGFPFILVHCGECGLLQAYDSHFLQVQLDHQKKR